MAVWNLTTLRDICAARRIDSEYFRPEYVVAERRVRACNEDDLGKLGGFVPGPFGSAFHVENYDYKSPYRYIRGRDVKPFFLLNDDSRYIPESDFKRLRQYEVQNDDLMISVVGTLGNVAVCTEEDAPAMFSCKSTLLRAWRIDPYFLLAYMNSTTGQLCLLRRQRGAIQTGLNMEDLRTTPVPRFEARIEEDIAESIRTAHRNLLASRDAYQSAQQLLESDLGLDKLTFEKPMGYTVRLSDLETAHRSDAQHYQPCFKQLTDHLSAFSTEQVRNIRTYNRRGLQPVYTQNGEMDVVNSQHLGPKHIDYEGLQKTSVALFAAAAEGHIQRGDLLIYTTGAYIGRTNVYLGEAPALASNHVNILRLHSSIDAAYMALVFQSVVGQFQTQKHARGSAQAELYPADIDRFVVPLLEIDKQKAIGDLLRESLVKQQESQQLLEQAKTRVEQLIEENVSQV